MLSFAEEIMLLLIDEERGDLSANLSPHILNIIFAGSVLMDLALEDRIDTDMESLILVDSTPLEDDLLDPVLDDIAQVREVHDTSYWIARTAKRSAEIRDKVLDRLVKHGILDSKEEIALSRLVSRSRRYPTIDGKTVEEVRLRVMRVLFSDDIPDPRDIVIISLADACGVFESLLSRSERDETRERIALLRKMDLIGRTVIAAIQKVELPPTTVSRPHAEIPQVPGVPLIGNVFGMTTSMQKFLVKQYVALGPIFRVRAFHRRFTVLAGPEANMFLKHQEKKHLRAYEFWRDFSRELGAKQFILSMDGVDHARLRKALAFGYSPKTSKSKLAHSSALPKMRSPRGRKASHALSTTPASALSWSRSRD